MSRDNWSRLSTSQARPVSWHRPVHLASSTKWSRQSTNNAVNPQKGQTEGQRAQNTDAVRHHPPGELDRDTDQLWPVVWTMRAKQLLLRGSWAKMSTPSAQLLASSSRRSTMKGAFDDEEWFGTDCELTKSFSKIQIEHMSVFPSTDNMRL